MPNTKTFDRAKIKNILVVRQHNQLGDMLCCTPFLAALKKEFTKASITLVASPFNCRMFEGGGSEYIDKLVIFDKGKVGSFIKLIKTLRKRKYDIGIVPSTVSMSGTSHYINFLSGAKIRIGAASIDGKKNKTASLLTAKKDFKWADTKMHQTGRNLEYAKITGAVLTDSERRKIQIKLNSEEIKFAVDYAHEHFRDRKKKVFAFHCGAGKVQNRWSRENFIGLIEKLYRNYDCYIVLTSGYMDIEVTDFIYSELYRKNIHAIILDKPHIRKIAAVLAGVDLYVTNDTGMMHTASFVNSKVIGLFGPTNSYEWGPINEFGRSIQSPTGNIDGITIEKVFEESKKLIELKRD
ncbi:MAG: glycosyltransferase family 9 protein [Ignavibacteria bacterium]|nr:glycosyltransferase family 9 protein [Ignavibacteria bacterium]